MAASDKNERPEIWLYVVLEWAGQKALVFKRKSDTNVIKPFRTTMKEGEDAEIATMRMYEFRLKPYFGEMDYSKWIKRNCVDPATPGNIGRIVEVSVLNFPQVSHQYAHDHKNKKSVMTGVPFIGLGPYLAKFKPTDSTTEFDIPDSNGRVLHFSGLCFVATFMPYLQLKYIARMADVAPPVTKE